MSFVPVADIDWIDASRNYARIHAGSRSHLLRETLKSLETRLDPERFVRVHRSAIVNVERIREFLPWFQGDWIIVLGDGTRIQTGKNYRARVRELIDG